MDVNLLWQNWPIVLVALITWLGVFAYLLRLDAMTRALEKQAEAVRDQAHSAQGLAEDDNSPQLPRPS